MFRNVLLKSQVCQINLKFSLKQNLITETQVLSNFLLWVDLHYIYYLKTTIYYRRIISVTLEVVTNDAPGHSVWKSHLNFWILAFSTNFCPILKLTV